jgi:hypothetical protein
VGWGRSLFALAVNVVVAGCTYGVYDGATGGLDGGAVGGEETLTVRPGEDQLLLLSDGSFGFHIPAGAVTEPITITVRLASSTGPIGTPVYDVTPHVSFARPITVLASPRGGINGQPGNVHLVTASSAQGTAFQPLAAVGVVGPTYFGLATALQFFTFAAGTTSRCEATPSCMASCCGSVGLLTDSTPSVECDGPNAPLDHVYQCLETCANPAALAGECQHASGVSCGASTCPSGTACCVSPASGRGCGITPCAGALLECDESGDCVGGQVCCLEDTGPGTARASCAATCPGDRQLCKGEKDCAAGGACTIPGQGCAFDTCGAGAPVPGICP